MALGALINASVSPLAGSNLAFSINAKEKNYFVSETGLELGIYDVISHFFGYPGSDQFSAQFL